MARRTLMILMTVVMVLTLGFAAPALAASISTTVTTTRTGDTLYVRKGPHKGNTPSVGVVKNKQKITLLEINDSWDGEAWSKIEINSTGAVGYLKNKYISYFGLDNSDGEIDKHEDAGWDYSDADDNDGHKGSGSSTSSSTTKYGRVSTTYGGSVNVRKSASTSSARVGSAYDGESLTLLSTSGSWHRVTTSSGITGYIYGDYVIEGRTARTTAANGVNFRKGAGTGYGIIRSLPYHTSIVVISRTANWSRVKVNGTYGYISNSYYQFW